MSDRDKIINRLLQNTAEIITPEEFKERLESGQQLTHYIGFEISGYVHLGTGILSALVMKDLTDLGVKCTVWLADWHTLINDKLDGTIETAQTIGKGYFAEAIKASYAAVGGNPDNIEFRLASDWYGKDWSKYWLTVVNVSKHTTISRMMRSVDIMGREAGPEMDHAKSIYPAMQAADIFYQNLDIAHAGMDQRKAHVIMRDVAEKIGQKKAVALHHPLLQSLNGKNKEDKMSKSNPDSAIFVHDTPEDIQRKIKGAFAPEKEIEHNPVLNWTRHLLFWSRTRPFVIKRKEEHGGDIGFSDFESLEQAYAAGEVHPLDLKNTVAQELSDMLAPIREHFAKPDISAMKKQLDDVMTGRR